MRGHFLRTSLLAECRQGGFCLECNTMKENKMGTMPVNKLLINMALPMMISMLVQALYNIVDSIFVARISEEALTAVSMAFPMQNLMIGVAGGVGVGTNALLSRALGEGRQEEACLLYTSPSPRDS